MLTKRSLISIGLLLTLTGCSTYAAAADTADTNPVDTSTTTSTTLVIDTTIAETTTTVDTVPANTPFSEKVVHTACSIYLQGGNFSDVLQLILDAGVSYSEKMALVKSVEIGTERVCPSLNAFSS